MRVVVGKEGEREGKRGEGGGESGRRDERRRKGKKWMGAKMKGN